MSDLSKILANDEYILLLLKRHSSFLMLEKFLSVHTYRINVVKQKLFTGDFYHGGGGGDWTHSY